MPLACSRRHLGGSEPMHRARQFSQSFLGCIFKERHAQMDMEKPPAWFHWSFMFLVNLAALISVWFWLWRTDLNLTKDGNPTLTHRTGRKASHLTACAAFNKQPWLSLVLAPPRYDKRSLKTCSGLTQDFTRAFEEQANPEMSTSFQFFLSNEEPVLAGHLRLILTLTN